MGRRGKGRYHTAASLLCGIANGRAKTNPSKLKDLFVREVKDRIRVLGAVRNAEECVRCHGGQRGDPLEAF